jgi:hypothetical protein
MTERPLSISTQIATPIQPGFSTTTSISANDALTSTESGVEDYTIKCICGWDQDDGATVYCEKCDTWQHIECFYPGQVSEASREDFDHSCADCKPRPLDRQRAIEFQLNQRQIKADNGDKKSKRAPSKSHKKKSKPSELQVNGYHGNDDHRNGSPQDLHPHTKKIKGHRSKESVSAQFKRNSPHTRQPSHAHPPSPAHTPPELQNGFRLHEYSDHFINLYNGDQAIETSTNSLANIQVTNRMSIWLNDETELEKDVGQKSGDVFQFLRAPANTLSWPDVAVDQLDMPISDTSMNLHVPYLRASHQIRSGCQIGELNGIVGLQVDYTANPENQWMEGYSHPKPLFFFPSHLPLVIDTRREGSKFRYVRRSCNANTVLENYIDRSQPMGYHFWLVSDRPIPPNEQITIPWDFRFPSVVSPRYLHLLNLTDEDSEQYDPSDITEEEYEKLGGLVRQVLSDYGGCACNLGPDCSFARFHRNYSSRTQIQPNGVKKRGRKSKPNHASPNSTGHATNSRAASEGQQDQYDEYDHHSPSGSSSRSKPGSRDITPVNGLGDPNGILSSDREKRKIAMVEASFRQMEQAQQPPKKKKRPSDGTTNPNPTQTAPKPRQRSVVARTNGGPQYASIINGKRGYVDAGTSLRESGSPGSVVSPNPASRRGSIHYKSRPASVDIKAMYSDSSTQTDKDENAWYMSPSPPSKRAIIPLSKRLLKNRLRLRSERQTQHLVMGVDDQSMATSPTVSMDLDTPMIDDRTHPDSPVDARGRHASISSSSPSVDMSTTLDVNMSDTPPIIVNNTIKPPPPPWPGHSMIPGVSTSNPPQKSPELRVQMPPAPTFTIPNMSGTPSPSGTPSSAAGSIAQSPFGTNFPNLFPTTNGLTAIPSPVRTTKKLTLSDYKRKRENASKINTGANEPSTGSSPLVAPAVLKAVHSVEEIRPPGAVEESAIVKVEKQIDSIDIVNPKTESTSPSREVNGTL